MEFEKLHPLIRPFIARQGYLVLDGGLATELEKRGFDLRDSLWSARLLVEAPQAIQQLHLDYLWAGADCVIGASYQASLPGFQARGFSAAAAAQLITRSVALALAAREEFWTAYQQSDKRDGRLRPLVAASIGPYGAFLANGAEYTGDYDLDVAGLVAWHRPRWEILRRSGADLFACETIPARREALALAQLLAESAQPAWVSFSCRDGAHLADGAPLAEVVPPLSALPNVAAHRRKLHAPAFDAGPDRHFAIG
jgi:homocysteine S-methyltransferase